MVADKTLKVKEKLKNKNIKVEEKDGIYKFSLSRDVWVQFTPRDEDDMIEKLDVVEDNLEKAHKNK